MAGFSEIIGQEHIKEHLQEAILSGMLSHAYILNGEKGCGKSMIANAFAMTLLCENGGAEPCMTCHSCKQVLSDNHPDIKRLITEKPNLIRVDEIRQQIVNDVAIKPYNGDHKIYIIPDAENMNPAAQNALLKTLEEPPAYVVILLLCNNADMLLETIRSRCVILNVRPLKDEQVLDYLMQTKQVPDYQARACAAFARGSIGRAMMLLQNEEFEEFEQEIVFVLKNIKTMDIAQINQEAKKLTQFSIGLQDVLDFLFLWFKDVALYKASRSTDMLLHRDEERLIQSMAKESSFEGIERILEMIKATGRRLNANVNTETTLELLLLTIKEN